MIASQPDFDAVAAAMRVLDDHFAALSARDAEALAATLHFPHFRLSANAMKVWQTSDTYLDDFYARAGKGWARSELLCRNVVAASASKVHLDVAFTRFSDDGATMGSFRSLWVITRREDRWAAELRSSFAE